MKNSTLLLFLAIFSSSAISSSVLAENLKVEANPINNWWWNDSEQPTLLFSVADTTGNSDGCELIISIRGDREDSPVCFSETVKLPLNGTKPVDFKITPQLAGPGFYRVSVCDSNQELKSFNIGFSPEKVVSVPDPQPDFNDFWDKAIAELEKVPLEATIVEIPEKSGEKRKIYFCQFLSLENDTVSGYLALPIKEGKYPAIIYYNGYNGQPWDIDPDGMPEWIEFQHWVRGQGPNKPYNRYDEYALYNIDNPEKYYYRSAYMDGLRTIDFIESLPQTDTDLIFAEGGSQGGAFTFAAAALDPKKRLKAIAPYIPFLTDFPDYFNIVHWPGDMAIQRAQELGMSEDQLYQNLSYFDIKNLTPRITIPVLMGVGLQDPTCPPHTNFAGYNNLSSAQKEFVIYPLLGHTVDYSDWNPRRLNLFQKIITQQ